MAQDIIYFLIFAIFLWKYFVGYTKNVLPIDRSSFAVLYPIHTFYYVKMVH